MLLERMTRLCLMCFCAASLMLSSCMPSGIEELSSNKLRITLSGSSAPVASDALKVLLKTAAQQTVSRGYRYFRFTDFTAGQSDVPQASQNNIGVLSDNKANFSVTIIMFHLGENGSNGSIDAQQIVEKNGAVFSGNAS